MEYGGNGKWKYQLLVWYAILLQGGTNIHSRQIPRWIIVANPYSLTTHRNDASAWFPSQKPNKKSKSIQLLTISHILQDVFLVQRINKIRLRISHPSSSPPPPTPPTFELRYCTNMVDNRATSSIARALAYVMNCLRARLCERSFSVIFWISSTLPRFFLLEMS